jgi:hypothetical protein
MIVISHIVESAVPNGGTYREAIFDVENPEPESTGKGKCSLESLQTLREIN